MEITYFCQRMLYGISEQILETEDKLEAHRYMTSWRLHFWDVKMDLEQSLSIPIFVSESDRYNVDETSLSSKGDFDEELIPISAFVDELKHDNFEVTYTFEPMQPMKVSCCVMFEG